MLIVALVLAVIGLVSLVTAVVTGNELIAWVCIAASVLGVILLIVDAIRERQSRDRVSAEGVAPVTQTVDETYENFDAEYSEDAGRAVAFDEPADEVDEGFEITADVEGEPATEVVPGSDLVTESEVSYLADETDPTSGAQYVTSEAPDSETAVRYVTSEEPETGIDYVTDDEIILAATDADDDTRR